MELPQLPPPPHRNRAHLKAFRSNQCTVAQDRNSFIHDVLQMLNESQPNHHKETIRATIFN